MKFTPKQIIPDNISDEYMCGKCMYLAVAMFRTYDLKMVVEICNDESDPYIGHSWNLLNADFAFDINGTNPVIAMGGYGDTIIVLDSEIGIRALMPTISEEKWNNSIEKASKIIMEFFEQKD